MPIHKVDELSHGQKGVSMNINLSLKDHIGAVKDIDQLVTDLVQAEKYSEQLEVEYQNIFNLAPDVIIKADLKGFVTSCNQAFSTLSGFTQEEIQIIVVTAFQVSKNPELKQLWSILMGTIEIDPEDEYQ